MATANLSQLRALHYPEVVLWFPPAIAWWVVLGGLLLMFVWLRLSTRRAYRKLALVELEQINQKKLGAHAYLLAVNQLLKRIALKVYGSDCAPLHGAAWLSFLDQQWDKQSLSKEAAVLLDIYQADSSELDYDRARLHVLLASWIKQHKRGPKNNDKKEQLHNTAERKKSA